MAKVKLSRDIGCRCAAIGGSQHQAAGAIRDSAERSALHARGNRPTLSEKLFPFRLFVSCLFI